jgi:hypothetical protein
MTRHETLTIGISTAALLISIGSPFFNYYLFQNEVRIRQPKSEAFSVEENVYGCPNLKTIIFEIKLKNTGLWEIEHVRLSIQRGVGSFDPNHNKGHGVLTYNLEKTGIQALPPLAISIQQTSKDFIVHFEEALPPKSDVELDLFQIRNVPPDVIYMYPDVESIQPFLWVSSEVSSFEVPWSFMVDCPNVERLRSVSTPHP